MSKIDRRLCDFARDLTKQPGAGATELFIQPLKEVGLSDKAILDATLVASYFNFVNRMVLALGAQLEEEPGGYHY